MAIQNVESDDDSFQSGTKRKVPSDSNRSYSKKGRSGGNRKTKSQIATETQIAERKARKQLREAIDVDYVMKEVDNIDSIDCCLVCASYMFKKCIDKDDKIGFKKVLDDVDRAPFPPSDNDRELGTYRYSIATGKTDFTDILHEKSIEAKKEKVNRPEIPYKYLKQDFGTGSNYGRGAYGRMAFRQVQLSRGNRQGDSAFYPDIDVISEDYKIQSDLDTSINSTYIHGFISYIAKQNFQDTKTIEYFRDHIYAQAGPLEIYYAIESGNRNLAFKLVDSDFHSRKPLVGLYTEVLQFTDRRSLTSYRKPQILKSAFDVRGITPFHCAAINPSRVYLQEFYEVLDSVERLKADNCGRTVVFFAAASETSDCLEYLISQGANISTMDKYRVTPLIQAARFGREKNVEVIIKRLIQDIKEDENPSIIFQSPIRNKKTALHLAAFLGYPQVCRTLIKHGCPVDAVELSEKQTALMFAAKNGHMECVRILIEEGQADPEKSDKYAKNALHLACISGHFDIVKYLLSQGLDSNTPDSSQNRPTHYAAAFGNLDILHLLIKYGQANPGLSNIWRTTPCSIANVKGHMATVKYLLNLPGEFIDVNFKNEKGRTMLQHTVCEVVTGPHDQEFSMRKSELLVSMNANVNSIDINDGAVYYERLVKMLVSKGANINIKNQDGETPLASAMQSNNHTIVLLLIQMGAKYWEDTDKAGNSFLHYFGRFIAWINQHQPHRDIDQAHKERLVGLADSMVSAIEDHQPLYSSIESLANTPNNAGYPPLVYSVHKAISWQKNAMKREKLMINDTFNHPFRYSSEYQKKYDLEAEKSRVFEVDLTFSFGLWIKYMSLILSKFGCNVNGIVSLPKDYKKSNPQAKKSQYPEHTGYGAIHLAAQTQSVDLIHFLLSNGSNPNLQINVENTFKDTPMIIAYHQKHDDFQESNNMDMYKKEQIEKRFSLKKPDFPTMLCQTIEIFIKFGGCPYLVGSNDCSPIMKAASTMDMINLKEMCKAAPTNLASINTHNSLGQTAFMIAIDRLSELLDKKETIDTQVAIDLLGVNADPNSQYENKDTVFMKIIKTMHVELFQTILDNTKVEIQHHLKNAHLEHALITACHLNQETIVDKYLSYLQNNGTSVSSIINTCDISGRSALSLAAGYGNFKATQTLLSMGANPNLYHLGVSPLLQAVRSKNVDVAEALLQAGADVTQKTLKGNTPLHIAVYTEKYQMVRLLLEYGADCNAVNISQKTPMHFAIEATKRQQNRSFRVESLLIEAGANLNAKDNFGRTPLHYVFVKMDFIPLNKHTHTAAKKYKQLSEDLYEEKEAEEKLLHFSKTYCLDSRDTADSWLESGKRKQLKKEYSEKKKETSSEGYAELTIQEKSSLLIFKNCNFEKVSDKQERFDPIDIVKYLAGFQEVDFKAYDNFERTPLHYAACVGAFSSTNILLSKEADIDAVDTDHNGALQLALQNGHIDYAIMLCNSGASFKNQVTMKNGQKASTFGYSLSISVINMAYMIMEKGINIFESIHDCLINGKFHMVELLLKSVQIDALSGILESKNQNIWHIISDFKPFDSELWQEYLGEIVAKIAPLKLSIFPDKFMRTPLHYAAKHGQKALLEYLLSNNAEINLYDEDLKTELYYAVEFGNTDNVKTLIRFGANTSSHKNFKSDSMLLKAVKSNQVEIVQLLLELGISTDEDSAHGRPNPVMVACQNENTQILSLLISAKADINTASTIERLDLFKKKRGVLVHPIFVASAKENDSIFKILLASNVNVNLHGPYCHPENGRSLFMYNVSMNKIDNQKALLEKRVDLDMLDGPDNQSIFYQFLFSQLGVYKKPEKDVKDISNKFMDFIFNVMIKEHCPQVSLMDEASGMTPLESAISENNYLITERLLLLGANPNVESCSRYSRPGFSTFTKTPKANIPAILHAILQNNLEIVLLICQKSTVAIDWMWRDHQGRNMLSYLFGVNNGYSTENVFLLDYIKVAMGSETFCVALQAQDNQMNTALTYALRRPNKFYYNRLIQMELNVTIPDFEVQQNEDPERMMETEYISMEQIENSAQREREILQKERDAKKESDDVNEDTDKKAEVDPYSRLEKIGFVEHDKDATPFDIMLLKVELSSWNSIESSFYKLSIIRNKVLDLYILWTRWGSYGSEGQHQSTPFLTKEEAAAEFKSIFRSKTGNAWEDRLNFNLKTGRYDILKKSHHPQDTIIEDFDFMSASKPSNLPSGVSNVMKLICNYQYLSKAYTSSSIDMPLGQISQNRLDQAYKLIMDIKETNEKYFAARKNFRDKEQATLAKSYSFKLAQKCVEYCRLMPRSNSDKDIVKPILFEKSYGSYSSSFDKEFASLLDLSYVGFAANVILAAKNQMNEISPLDYAYRSLNCSLQEIQESETDYDMIKSYMCSSSSGNELLNVFSVQREEEKSRFKPYENSPNRALLWHGSRIGNFMGILKQGLRGAPQIANNNGALLGTGVYFADCFSKSLGYSQNGYSSPSPYSIMLLCEVALGEMEVFKDKDEIDPSKYNSVQAIGMNIPNPLNTLFDAKGTKLMFGPCIDNPPREPEKFLARLNYNEYMVHDESRVKIRYLLIVKNKATCTLCLNTDSANNKKSLNDYKFKSFDYSLFNSYEKEIAKSYVSHQQNDLKAIFDANIEQYIDRRLYKKKWNTPLDIDPSSTVCNSCSEYVLSMVLENILTSEVSTSNIPGKKIKIKKITMTIL
ncbi:ankyrin repeat-containing domain protein [Sporodiniella umbellata]|nr:ankyrin repeat-containing domain protein [Sporodiniella umbellata]